jgi:hypothetical protein
MKFEKDTSGIKRYIGFDIHKEYALVGGQNARQEWVLQPRRVGLEKFCEWAQANLQPGDAAIIETTTNVWDVYDIVAPLVRYVVVAVWHVLSKEETDEHVSEEDLAYKMLVLAWDLDEDVRMGLSYKQFAKYALMKLGVENDITRFVRKNVARRVAPKAEVLARMEELGLTC